MRVAVPLFVLVGTARLTLGLVYRLEDDIVGRKFYDAFIFENIPDPTHGRVHYVDKPTAISENLTFAKDDTFILRADDKTVLHPQGPGRKSVRLRSVDTYTRMLLIFNVRHMPQGCGTWPAIWTVGPNWPHGGEIDIVEGVNDQHPNGAALHTDFGCRMPGRRQQLGTSAHNDCNAYLNWNSGCGVKFPTAESYGPPFNRNGGGWYAMERSSTHIKVWFWPRNGGIPFDVQSGADSVNPDDWGTPTAYFPNSKCDIDRHFAAQFIVINLTFCGDWAGNTYAQSGCPGTCVDYVNRNPRAFTDAYFDLASLKIYKRQAPEIPVTVESKVTGGLNLFQQLFRLTGQVLRK
jgi:hypothetical protein